MERKRRSRRKTWADFYTEAAIADSLMAGLGMRPEEAVENQLLLALEHDPEHVEALNLMAQIRAQQGRDAEALDYLRRAVASATKHRESHELITEMFLTVAELYEERECFDQARGVYDVALVWREDPRFFNGRGICLAADGDANGAVEAFRRAMGLASESQVYVNNYGYALFQAGKLEEAREALRRAVAMDPTDLRARHNLAACEQALGAGQAPPRRRPRRPAHPRRSVHRQPGLFSPTVDDQGS